MDRSLSRLLWERSNAWVTSLATTGGAKDERHADTG